MKAEQQATMKGVTVSVCRGVQGPPPPLLRTLGGLNLLVLQGAYSKNSSKLFFVVKHVPIGSRRFPLREYQMYLGAQA